MTQASATAPRPGWTARLAGFWMLRGLRFGLPLLVKDLTELAARRRTYIVRSVYAGLLFLAFALYFMSEVSGRRHLNQVLGAGRGMLEFLIVIQLVGVYLFLPAMVAPSIAAEKEHGTLGLLLVTDLGPWEIIVQKYLSRLAPMFMFLLLSLPLMAVAYSLGGFSSAEVLVAACLIFTTCFQVAAWALMWSAFCRNTSEATGVTYVGAVALAFAVGVVGVALHRWFGLDEDYAGLIAASLAPPVAMEAPGSLEYPRALLYVAPWVWTAAFLVLARVFLVRRAFIKARRPKSLFRRAQDLFRLLVSLVKGAGGRKVRRAAGDLPGERPVTWCELAGSSLRTPVEFAFTAAVLVLVLVGGALLFAHWIGFGDSDRGLGASFVVWGVWIAGALAIAAKAASAFARERANNTLDVLITTPLTGREIVAQKAAGVGRRALFLFVLLGALFLFEIVLETRWTGQGHRRGLYSASPGPDRDFGRFGYLLISFLSVAVYLWMAGWLAGWIGLRLRKQAQATAIAFGAIFALCVGPFMVAAVVAGSHMDDGVFAWLLALSPATIVVLTEIANFDDIFREAFGTHAAFPILLNFSVCGGIALVFRTLCLAKADRYLGRPVSSGGPG